MAVNVADVATPPVLVTAVFTPRPPANVPLAALFRSVNVTATPATGLPLESFTVTCSANAKAVLTTTFCGVPPVAVIVAGAVAVFVRLKLAGPRAPAVAVTV